MNGRTALVTGGSTGIGFAVAAALADAGVGVTIAGRDPGRGATAAAALAGRAGGVRFVAADVRDEASVKHLVEDVRRTGGAIDFLFNNAGVEGALGPLAGYPVEDLEDLLATNVKGVFLLLKHVLPAMQARNAGVVVNNASFVGSIVPLPDGMAYGATKAAVLSMTRAAAAGVGSSAVRVFAVCPWMTDTPMVDRLTGHQAEAKRQFAGINPSGVLASPQDVAAVVTRLFAGSQDLENGGALLVDAGAATTRVLPASAAS